MRTAPSEHDVGSTIGDNVTIGHSAMLTGVTVGDNAFIGIGATLLEGVQVMFEPRSKAERATVAAARACAMAASMSMERGHLSKPHVVGSNEPTYI